MIQLQIHVNVLQALRLFAAKEDLRRYLNGVCCEMHGHDATLIATNGHTLAVYRAQGAIKPDPVESPVRIIVPIGLLDKLKILSKGYATLSFVLTRVDGYGISLVVTDYGQFQGESVDGSFPDWKSAIGMKDTPYQKTVLSSRYVKAMADAAKLLNKKCDPVEIHARGTAPAFARFSDPNFFAVIMPMGLMKDPPESFEHFYKKVMASW